MALFKVRIDLEIKVKLHQKHHILTSGSLKTSELVGKFEHKVLLEHPGSFLLNVRGSNILRKALILVEQIKDR
jgi:hypothetical protein